MNRFALSIGLLMFCSIPFSSYSQKVNCSELISFARGKGSWHGGLNALELFGSSWLKKVDAYKIENTIVVIAEIKQDEYGLSTKQYIFCGISSVAWDRFKIGLYDIGLSPGERFHKYIYDNRCDCY